MCYCREKFAINFSGSRALFILNLGCYFHFLKVKKNCQFSMILHLQDIHFGFIGLQNIKNWPEVVKSTVCIVWSCFFFFTKVRMSRLLLWREHNIPKNCQESCHMNYFFLWSRTHIFSFLTKVWHESSCLCPLLKVASQTFHLLDLNILSYAHHFWLFRTQKERKLRLPNPSFSILDFSLNHFNLDLSFSNQQLMCSSWFCKIKSTGFCPWSLEIRLL